MSWFKPKEDREEIRYQDERDRDYEKRREEAEEARREDEENRADREEYISELESELTGEDTTIITIHLLDDDNGWHKQIALNFMLKHGYICVQNDVCCERYTLHHDLTFVKKENVDFFKC